MKLAIVIDRPQLPLKLDLGPEWVHPQRAKLRYLGEVLREGSVSTVSRYELECGHVVERFERTVHERLRCELCPSAPPSRPAAVRRRGPRTAARGARAVLAAIDAAGGRT